MPNPEGDKRPPRERYLETIGLKWPGVFDTPVAELELGQSTNDIHATAAVDSARPPYFYDFFVEPPLTSSPPIDNLQKTLRSLGTTLIFGRPGDGKTTLRLALEAYYRRSHSERTLAVAYILQENFNRPPTPLEHRQQLAKVLAIDLVIQVIERFNPLDRPPTGGQIAALAKQLLIGGTTIQQLVRRVLDEPEPDSIYGLSAHWSLVHRPVVRRVVSSPALLDLLRQTQQVMPAVQLAEDRLSEGWQAMQLWGFEQCYVLVDGVDTNTTRSPNFMLRLLQPLFDQLAEFEEHRGWLKFFLPLELATAANDRVQRQANQLTIHPISFIMGQWQPMDFQRLLAARFRTAGSRRVSWMDLAADDLPGNLDHALVQAARGSPRRYLQLIQALIDAHALRDPLDRYITLDDWVHMQEQWANADCRHRLTLNRSDCSGHAVRCR